MQTYEIKKESDIAILKSVQGQRKVNTESISYICLHIKIKKVNIILKQYLAKIKREQAFSLICYLLL